MTGNTPEAAAAALIPIVFKNSRRLGPPQLQDEEAQFSPFLLVIYVPSRNNMV
jgi:hypothetical protein